MWFEHYLYNLVKNNEKDFEIYKKEYKNEKEYNLAKYVKQLKNEFS